MDWGELATAPDYVQAAVNSLVVGNLTGAFLARIVQVTLAVNPLAFLNPQDIHLVGFDLGGQTESD